MRDADFTHGVFLGYRGEDKAVVRALAERLKADGLRVWFDEWQLKPGDSIPAKIEDGWSTCACSCSACRRMPSASEWAQLEAGTFRFRNRSADQEIALPALHEWQQALAQRVAHDARTFLVAGRTDVCFRFDRENSEPSRGSLAPGMGISR